MAYSLFLFTHTKLIPLFSGKNYKCIEENGEGGMSEKFNVEVNFRGSK